MWVIFRRHFRQWNSSFAAPHWIGRTIKMWRLLLLWCTRKVTKFSWKNVIKWLFTTLENLAETEELINPSEKCFSCFQRHCREAQCMLCWKEIWKYLSLHHNLRFFTVGGSTIVRRETGNYFPSGQLDKRQMIPRQGRWPHGFSPGDSGGGEAIWLLLICWCVELDL